MNVRGSRWRRRGSFRSAPRRRRAVSDVVATILLLALTVTLFSAIFAFVTAFPAPPAQNNNQFQASLVFTANASYVASVKIVHLAGPAIPGNAQIFLKSAVQPTAPEFQSPYYVSSGLSGTTTWNLGQVWSLTFSTSPFEQPSARGNITVYIVSQSQLLYSVILPGTALISPPTIISTSVSPATPLVGKSFTVYATLAGTYKANSVFVNLAAVPGGPSTPQIMTANAQGQWTFTWSSGASSNGTFYGFVNASGPTGSGLTAVAAVVITVSTGGGTTNGPFSVGVILIPSPPNGNTTESVQAVVTYTGVLSPAAALNVTFTEITNPYTAANKWVSWAPSGVTIAGGSSVTVVAKNTWLIPNPFTHPSVTAGTAFTVYANATVTGVGTVPGTLTFTPPYLNTGSTKSALISSSISANGTYFTPRTPVALSIGGVVQKLTSCSVGALSSSDMNVTTNATGAFTCTFAIAPGSPMLAANLLATDLTTGQNATASFTPIDWSITITAPTSGLMNSTVTIGGVGFVSSTTLTFTFAGQNVTFASSCTTGTPSKSTVKVVAAGSFSGCTFRVPFTAPSGADSVVATDAAGQTATATYTVTPWNVTASPSWVSIKSSTTSVTLTGSGFASGSKVSIVYNGTLLTNGTLSFKCANGELVAGGSTITPTSSGSFSCTLTLTRDPPGIYTFTATAYPSGQVAVASVGRS